METTSAAYGVGAPRQKLEFKYDYLGRRVEKLVYSWNSGWSLQSQKRFIHDGWNLIAEYSVSGGSLTLARTMTWGLDISVTLADAGGVRGLLMVTEGSNGPHYLPAYDGNGNILAMVNRGTGTLDAVYEYSPFGETIRSIGTYATTNPFRFSTKYTDQETQLVYYGLRYYNPSLGRWLGRDPIEEKGGLHLYAFVRNNPINLWDVLGNVGAYISQVCQFGETGFQANGGGNASIAGLMRSAPVTTVWEGVAATQLQMNGFTFPTGGTSGTQQSTTAKGDKGSTNGNSGLTPSQQLIADNLASYLATGSAAATITSNGSGLVQDSGGLTGAQQLQVAGNAIGAMPGGSLLGGFLSNLGGNIQVQGSVAGGLNATLNPAYGFLAGGYEAITGLSLNPDSLGQTLTTSGRVLSGVSAGANAAGLVLGAVGVTQEITCASTAATSSLWDTSATLPGSRYMNVATDVSAQDFGANLVSNGYKVTTRSGGAMVFTNGGQTTYTIYTATSTGGTSVQVFDTTLGKIVIKYRLP
jgi:RHS repeat-associated protein